ncbi:DUF6114 domain-containing protein [Kitasatospora purpeofusca]|uniref:DUF6114 domain-containing protein n=1 Tax=Kitasatospora purpeofusca TaxID=67352 RepID=UPI002B1E02BA|nr:DUF6114 domain-containing protein [Kitasatospora purpeofusca]
MVGPEPGTPAEAEAPAEAPVEPEAQAQAGTEPPAGSEVQVEPKARAGAVARARRAWRGWRGRRPFWGGVLVLFGGAEILFTLRAPLPIVLHIGIQGLAGYLVPAVMVLCGLLILFNPAQRLFYSILAVLASLGSWLTSNLGGFLLGMLFGVIGSCLAFGWLPDQPPRRRWLRRDRTGRKAADPAGV